MKPVLLLVSTSACPVMEKSWTWKEGPGRSHYQGPPAEDWHHLFVQRWFSIVPNEPRASRGFLQPHHRILTPLLLLAPCHGRSRRCY